MNSLKVIIKIKRLKKFAYFLSLDYLKKKKLKYFEELSNILEKKELSTAAE